MVYSQLKARGKPLVNQKEAEDMAIKLEDQGYEEGDVALHAR